MRITPLVFLLFVAAAATALHARASQLPSPEPVFDAVSIRPHTGGGMNVSFRPDGGIALVNVAAGLLVTLAYPAIPTTAIIGMPDWARSESDRYDVMATVVPGRANPTPAQRQRMLRALLAERFQFAARVETREQPAYALVLARRDGRLGPGLKPSDCEARAAAQKAAVEAGSLSPCTFRPSTTVATGAQKYEGDITMAFLASMLRTPAGRPVVEQTGLSGTYQVLLEFMPAQAAPTTADTSGPPLLFTAIQEQLGLKLESTRAPGDSLIIERMERPTAN
jgi:uncharacterized protein (TIGR03435 family)